MFIKHTANKERINLARCTNYYSQDWAKQPTFVKKQETIYQIVFMFADLDSSSDCAVWNFDSIEEREKVLAEIDDKTLATLIG